MSDQFPEGQLTPDDEGALWVEVKANLTKGVIIINYGKPVSWLGMEPVYARAFAAILLQKADELDPPKKCTVCGLPSQEGADEEGDGGWWCLACIKKWEAANGCHWEDGKPIEP